MSLTSAMLMARSSIQARAAEMAIASRNVSNVNNSSYTRLNAVVKNVVSDTGSVVYVSHASRMANQAALKATLRAGSLATASGSYANLLNELNPANADPFGTRLATSIGELNEKLVAYANDPSNLVFGQSVVNSANGIVENLKSAVTEVEEVRLSADAAMERATENINNLLSDIEGLNNKIVAGSGAAQDVNALMDQRDELVKVLSEEVGIDVLEQANNGIAIYTDSGVTLFEKIARDVTFSPSVSLGSGEKGGAIQVDGVAITGEGLSTAVTGGAIAGYAKMRDATAVTMQTQLDETARALIDVFMEEPNALAPAGTATKEGLFVDSGALGTTKGLASRIQVNDAVSGNPQLLRDGGINGADYISNAAGNDGFSDQLRGYVEELTKSRSFSSEAGVNTNSSLESFTANTVSWFGAERKLSVDRSTLDAASFQSSAATLSNKTGVNIDTEMQRLLTIENAYSASARLMTTIDDMFKELLSAVR